MRKWYKTVKGLAAEYGYRLRKKRNGSNHLILVHEKTGKQLYAPSTPKNEMRSINALKVKMKNGILDHEY